MSDDSRTGHRRHQFEVDRIETVEMTAQQYEQAVNALATLIAQWMRTRHLPDNTTSGHPDSDWLAIARGAC